MAFLDVSFPSDVASGAVSGLRRRTNVVSVGAGYEERDQRWADARRVYQAGLGLRSAANLAAVMALYQEARGAAHSFRFKDWADYRSSPDGGPITPVDQVLGTGDGAETMWPLSKAYGTLNPYIRAITKPVAGSVRVSLDGVEQVAGWSVDHLTGVVAFAAAPALGVQIAAGFEFDTPVRFESDALDIDLTYFHSAGGVGTVPDIALVEVRE